MTVVVVTALFVASPAFTPAAEAGVSITIRPTVLRHRLFLGNERVQVRGNDFWIRAVQQAWMLDYRAQHPHATKQQLVAELANFDGQLRAAGVYNNAERSVYRIINSALQVLIDAGIPIHSGGASALKEIMQMTWGDDLTERMAIQDQITGSWLTYEHIRAVDNTVDEILLEMLMTAEHDRDFGDARDAFFGGLSRASVYTTESEFLHDPVLATWFNTTEILDLVKKGNLERDQLMQWINENWTALSKKIDALRTTQVNTLIQTNAVHPLTVTGQRGTPDEYRAAQLRAQQNARLIDTARTGVWVIATIAGFADPTVGNAIERIGGATLQVASAINAYVPTVVGLGIGQALLSASTVALTGNLLGAAMSLLPLFIGHQPTPEETMMQKLADQLGRIHADLRDLGVELNGRFDRIENGMNALYNEMLFHFNEVYVLFDHIDERLGELDARTRQIAQELTRLEGSLDEIGQRLQAALLAVHLKDLKETINFALGHEAHYNEPLSDPDFRTAENRFLTYAKDVSIDAASTTMMDQFQIKSNVDIDPNLAEGDLTRNFAYLQWLAHQRFGYGTPPSRNLANPAVWSLAAEAYARLMVENPVIASTIADQHKVKETGADLDSLTRHISRPTDGAPNALLTGLVADYRETVEGFSSALSAERDKIQGVARAVELFGDANQSIPPPETPDTITACDSGQIALSTPSSAVLSGLPNAVYTALAGYRAGPGLPQMQSCYAMETRYTESTEIIDVTIKTRFRLAENDPWRVVRSAKAENVYEGPPCEEGDREIEDGRPVGIVRNCPSGVMKIRAGWDSTYRAKVAAVTPTLDETAVSVLTSTMTAFLRSEARRYVAIVSGGLSQAGTPLRNAVKAMTGAATLLRAYLRLGFPKALQADDLMSGMLQGTHSILSETSGAPIVSTTYAVAAERFIPCASGQDKGCTPSDHLYEVLWRQSHLSEEVVAPGEGLPGERVGDALVQAAQERLHVLEQRIKAYSEAIASGEHTEGLPIYEELASRLDVARSIVNVGPPALAVSDVTVTEGDSGAKAVVFTISRVGALFGSSTVSWNTADGTAGSGAGDYAAVASPNPVTFARGESFKLVSVTVNGDLAMENNETFSVKLTSPVGAAIADDTGIGTIVNDDAAVAVNDVAVAEGNSGTKAVTFRITRSGNTATAVSVNWATADGTAVSTSDYTAVPLTTINLAAGETTKDVSVTVRGDTSVEPNETFAVRLSSPVGATIADDTGIGTIVNDDAAVAVNDVAVAEGNSGTKAVTFRITRSGNTATEVSVNWATADGTAVSTSDYTAVPLTTVNLAAGEITKDVSVTVRGDTTVEPNETFAVRLSSPVGATIADDTGIGTTVNDDGTGIGIGVSDDGA